jgi:lactoylglutathione lyase
MGDLERSLAFYTDVGYEVVGSVPETGLGHLTMLKLPDDEFVAIELVHDPKVRSMSAPGSATSSSRWSNATP